MASSRATPKTAKDTDKTESVNPRLDAPSILLPWSIVEIILMRINLYPIPSSMQYTMELIHPYVRVPIRAKLLAAGNTSRSKYEN